MFCFVIDAGGPFFNLFNLGKDPKEMKTLKLKEIKNGRLAMLAIFGYGAQVGRLGLTWTMMFAYDGGGDLHMKVDLDEDDLLPFLFLGHDMP